MTDKELLELAAKAAGLRGVAVENFEGPAEFRVIPGDGSFSSWNPLQDDGDALRLAVKLGIKVTPYPIFSHEKHSVIASRRWWFALPVDDERTYVGPEVIELYGDDPAAATRRAIVRAAAAMAQAGEGAGRG